MLGYLSETSLPQTIDSLNGFFAVDQFQFVLLLSSAKAPVELRSADY